MGARDGSKVTWWCYDYDSGDFTGIIEPAERKA